MQKLSTFLCAGMLAVPAAMAGNVQVDPGTAPWLGFMNVYELPANGGAFVFPSSWGVADLTATFDDANNKLTLSPNTIGDPNEFWYQDPTGGGNPNPGGPGAPGNKIMEANLYQEATDVFNGQVVTFSGTILSDTFTAAHEASIFIRDFAPDYSSVVETFVPATVGAFSINLAADPGAGRHIQWGFQVKGVNVWATDVDPFGNLMIETVPTPGTLALLGFGGIAAARRRR